VGFKKFELIAKFLLFRELPNRQIVGTATTNPMPAITTGSHKGLCRKGHKATFSAT